MPALSVPAEFAIKFILENAQETTGPNLRVYGTLYPSQLSELTKAIPNGKKIYEAACESRAHPRKRKS